LANQAREDCLGEHNKFDKTLLGECTYPRGGCILYIEFVMSLY